MATLAAPVATPGQKKNARLWWQVHQWVGFKLSLLLAFIFLTGTLAVFSSEIDWLLNPSLRVSPASVGGSPDWEKIAVNASNHPGVARVNYIGEPTASAFAVRVAVDYTDGNLGYLHAHPVTGAIQGQTGFVDAQRILRNMHRHLNLPAKYGIPIVTALSFLMLVTLVTSFVVYKKWWRGFLRWPRGRDARTWWGDFHRLAGVWSLWFVALIALTALWYFIESVGGNAPQAPDAEAAAFAGSPPEVSAQFARSLAAARAADPDLLIQNIRFPTEKSGTFIFEGAKSAILVRPRANAVTTEVATGRILLVTDGTDLTVHQRISEMADPLHFGYFGGYWTKIPWFLFGLLLTGLAVSGVAIYGLRIGKELRAAVTTATATQIAWRGMGRWRWLAVALIIVSFALLPALFEQRA
jgi:uncharacterized iron-regulated membrane protein